MPLTQEQSLKYVSDVDEAYKGIPLTHEKKQEIMDAMERDGVSYEDYSNWANSRQSFTAGEGEMGFANTPDSDTRIAGPLESISILRGGKDNISKSIENGVFPQSVPKIAYNYVVDPALNAAQIGVAMYAAPAEASAVGLNALGSYVKYATKVASTGLTSDLSKKAYKELFLGEKGEDEREIAANVFDNFSSSMVPLISQPFAKGGIGKPIMDTLSGLVYGAAQGTASSAMRGENGSDYLTRGAITGGLTAFGAGASALSGQENKADLIGKNTKILTDVGVTPELGMVDPEYAHAMMAKADRNIAIGDRLNEKFNSFLNNLTTKVSKVDNVSGYNNYSSPSEATKKLSEMSSALPKAEASLASANESASIASKALEMAKSERSKSFNAVAAKNSQKQEDAIKGELKSAINGFYEEQSVDAYEKAIGNGARDPITAQQARLVADDQIGKTFSAFKAAADAKFDLVDQNAVFDSKSVRSSIERELELAPASQRDSILNLFDSEVEAGGGEGISLGRLLNVKRKLWNGIGNGPSTPEDHFLRNSAVALGKDLEAQAPSVLGKDQLAKFNDANTFYRNIEAFKAPAVKDILWGSNEHSSWAQKIVSDVGKNGIGKGTMYDTVINAASSIDDANTQKIYRAKIADAFRSYIFDGSTVIDLSAGEEGAKKVISPRRFADAIKPIAQRQDALKEFGFGDSFSVNRFIKLATEDFPDAKSLTPESLNTLLTVTGTKRGESTANLERLTSVIQDMAAQHASSKMKKAAIYEAIGNIGESRKAVYDARAALGKAKIKVGSQEEVVADLKNNPIVQIFRDSNVNISSFNDIKSTFFDSSGIKNEDLRKLMSSLENGWAGKPPTRQNKMLASALKVSFLNDALDRVVDSSNPSKSLKMFASALEYNENPASLYQRTVALFGNQTVKNIRQDYYAASLLSKTIRAGVPDISASKATASLAASAATGISGVGIAGTSAAGLARNSVDWIVKGKYAMANLVYGISPELYTKSKSVTGLIGDHISKMNFSQKSQFIMQNKEAAQQYYEESSSGQQKSPQ